LHHTAFKLTFVINKPKSIIIKMKTKSFIAALLLTTSSAFAQVPSYVPTNGLVGWWPFNGNANDESGNNNNGNINGGSFINDRNGLLNSALGLPNLASNSMVSNVAPPFNNLGLSVSVWLRLPNQYNQSSLAVIKNGVPYSNGFYVAIDQNNQAYGVNNYLVVFLVGNGTAVTFISNQSELGQWSHLVSTYDGNSIKMYLNGILKATQPFNLSLNCPNNDLIFGQWDNPTTPSVTNRNIDDIGIWNRALSQQEITNLYNAQTCIGIISPDGPTTFCAGNSVNLKSDVVGGTYQWKKNGVNINTNATTKTYKATATGSYTCVATCNGSALTSNAIAVTSKTNAAATVSASGATSFCAGDSVTLNATNLGSNYSVQWYRTNISMENATNYSQVVKQPGTYKVVTRNLTNGCSRISGSAITTNVNCRIAGDVTSGAVIQENTNVDSRFIDNELSQGVHIFPNPNSGVFSFNYDGEETGDAVLQVINNLGQSIYQSRLTIPEGGFTQDLQLGDNITKGIYIVRLLINDSYHDSKVMVK
jgi:hypothetical protein